MVLKASCHCGGTRFEVDEAPASVTRCTCSICSKKGSLWAYYEPAQFRLQPAPTGETAYRWSSRSVTFHHCPTCGCSTYNETFDWSSGEAGRPMISVNARLFDEFDLDAVPVHVIDGRNLW
jgi:hypothetical protein